jgi:hypothetical protein
VSELSGLGLLDRLLLVLAQLHHRLGILSANTPSHDKPSKINNRQNGEHLSSMAERFTLIREFVTLLQPWLLIQIRNLNGLLDLDQDPYSKCGSDSRFTISPLF